jgi:hypothetical protein
LQALFRRRIAAAFHGVALQRPLEKADLGLGGFDVRLALQAQNSRRDHCRQQHENRQDDEQFHQRETSSPTGPCGS